MIEITHLYYLQLFMKISIKALSFCLLELSARGGGCSCWKVSGWQAKAMILAGKCWPGNFVAEVLWVKIGLGRGLRMLGFGVVLTGEIYGGWLNLKSRMCDVHLVTRDSEATRV